MSNGNCGRQRVNLQWFSASRLMANYHYAKWCMQQFSSLTFICDNMMLLVLNEHLNASLVALTTCITAGEYQGMKNLWAHWPLRSRPLGVIGMDLTLKTFPWAHVSLTCYQAEFHWQFLCCNVTQSWIIDRNFCPFGGTHSEGVGQCNIYIWEKKICNYKWRKLIKSKKQRRRRGIGGTSD